MYRQLFMLGGILTPPIRSDPARQASHGALSRRPRCPTHLYCLLACCCTGAWVVTTCCSTPLQPILKIVFELQAVISSRKVTFGGGQLEQPMPPHQTLLLPTAPLMLNRILEGWRLTLRR